FADQAKPKKFPVRQTKESFQAIARLHQLDESRCIYALQNPDVIDSGVFHNDVISVGNCHVFFTHEKAFANQQAIYDELRVKCALAGIDNFEIIEVPESMVSVEDAVSSYLFNSQLVNTDNGMVLVAPSNCEENIAVKNYTQHLVNENNSITEVKFYDVKQSMANGGGPACLRLRIVLNEDELANLSGRVILDDNLYNDLVTWIEKYYRDSLAPEELGDVALLNETKVALTELSEILQLPNLYDFTA
nr:N-succinylarginine dihydrolase [Gammaproteobacteria bacterium]